MTTNVVFLCPHAAAKSVMAAALLRQAADARNIDVTISNAGTDPDPELNPIVLERLVADQLPIAGTPRLVTHIDLDEADVIVNIGCDHDLLPTAKPVEDWSIPNFSDDPPAAFAALELHVAALADGLA